MNDSFYTPNFINNFTLYMLYICTYEINNIEIVYLNV